MDRNLQTVSNYFLLSLSVADFTIGAISMPLYTIYLVLGYWPLGPIFCDIWLSLDYTMSNASVANLLVISFDRYMSVTRPLTYRVRRTRRRAAAMIAGAWVVSILLWTPWIIAWPHIEGQRTVPADDCYIQFLKSNEYLTIGTAVAAFYLPVVILCVVYHRIYRETRRHQRNLYELRAIQLLQPHTRSDAGSPWNDYDHETGTKTGCLAACRNRLQQHRLCRWMTSATCGDSDEVDERFDEHTTSGIPDDGQQESTTMAVMCKSQSVPDRAGQRLINSVSDGVLDQSELSTASTLVQPSQCQCSWHAGSAHDDLSSLPSSSRYPIIILTVEFADDPVKEDATATNNEEQRDSRLSTEEPECLPKSVKNGNDRVSQPASRYIRNPTLPSTSLLTVCRSDGPADQRRASELVRRRPSSPSAASDRRQSSRQHPQTQEKRQDYKALRMLSAILLAFLLTWSPYNLFTVIQAFCATCINPTLYAVGECTVIGP